MSYFTPEYWVGAPDAIHRIGLAAQVPLVIFLLGLCYAIFVQVMGPGFQRRLALIPLSLLPFVAAWCGASLLLAAASTGFHERFGRSDPTAEQIDQGEVVVRAAIHDAMFVTFFGALETIILFCFAFLLLLGKHAGPRPVAR